METLKKFDHLRPGMLVEVHQKIKEMTNKGEEKERIQIFSGLIISHKHGSEEGATITVRKISHGVGVEKIFPLHMPDIDHIEVVKEHKVRRAKLFYLRDNNKKLKEITTTHRKTTAEEKSQIPSTNDQTTVIPSEVEGSLSTEPKKG